MKIELECRVRHVLQFTWDVEFDGDIKFHMRPKERSRSGKARSNNETHFFVKSIPILSSYVLKSPACFFVLCRIPINARKAFQKVKTSIFFTFVPDA